MAKFNDKGVLPGSRGVGKVPMGGSDRTDKTPARPSAPSLPWQGVPDSRPSNSDRHQSAP